MKCAGVSGMLNHAWSLVEVRQKFRVRLCCMIKCRGSEWRGLSLIEGMWKEKRTEPGVMQPGHWPWQEEKAFQQVVFNCHFIYAW